VQLLIVLEREDPPVWRRAHASAFTQLGGLHSVIQGVMAWGNRVPHRFILAEWLYSLWQYVTLIETYPLVGAATAFIKITREYG